MEGLREVETMELSAVVEKAWLFTAATQQLRGGGRWLSLPTLSLLGLYIQYIFLFNNVVIRIACQLCTEYLFSDYLQGQVSEPEFSI